MAPPALQSNSGAAPPAFEATTSPFAWRKNALLFLATLASVFFTAMKMRDGEPPRLACLHAGQFTATLLGILLAHEFGHFTAARIHKVDASLPYFIPLPILSPFGTMGAVIRMRSVIPTRRALLDIGAAGPLAGLAVAIPTYAWGAAHSMVVPNPTSDGWMELGDSLLLRALDHIFAPPVADGMQLALSPVAYAAWAGMFVTMINLLPVGQLDGGHVAYALFGVRQNGYARWVHRSMLAFFFVSVASFMGRDLLAGVGLWHLGSHIQNSLFWLVWFEVLAILARLTGSSNEATSASDSPLGVRTRAFATFGLVFLAGLFYDRTSPLLWIGWFVGLGVLLAMEAKWGCLRPDSSMLDHPATGAAALNGVRVAIAVVTLTFFALLFMPTPFAL